MLMATLGSEPQVVSAALDLLLRQSEPITKVLVLHTTAPGTPVDDAVEVLKKEYGSPQDTPVQFGFTPILDETSRPLADIDTLHATRAAFRSLFNQLRLAKQDGFTIHLSIAGGRKTLAVYGMASALPSAPTRRSALPQD